MNRPASQKVQASVSWWLKIHPSTNWIFHQQIINGKITLFKPPNDTNKPLGVVSSFNKHDIEIGDLWGSHLENMVETARLYDISVSEHQTPLKSSQNCNFSVKHDHQQVDHLGYTMIYPIFGQILRKLIRIIITLDPWGWVMVLSMRRCDLFLRRMGQVAATHCRWSSHLTTHCLGDAGVAGSHQQEWPQWTYQSYQLPSGKLT